MFHSMASDWGAEGAETSPARLYAGACTRDAWHTNYSSGSCHNNTGVEIMTTTAQNTINL